MEFPITDLLSEAESENWIREHFHPQRLKCPGCGLGEEAAYAVRRTQRSSLVVYRCMGCGAI